MGEPARPATVHFTGWISQLPVPPVIGV